MKLDTTFSDCAQVLTVLDDRIDSSVAIQFKDAVREATANAPNFVILDLHRVRFVDSSGLGAIVASMKLLAPSHKLDLAGLTPDVDKVFKLTRMDQIFEIFDDIEAALDHRKS